MTTSVFSIHNLKHRYNGSPVLNIPFFSIPGGSITGLAGPNGSGKTTLLNILALTTRPSEGSVHFKNSPAGPFSDPARLQVTLLPQEPYLLKRSVFGNIAYGLHIRKDTENLTGRVHDALTAVGLNQPGIEHRKWNELSGGEARRVALAARLILKPSVLLLDEPTANIDARSTILIRNAILQARNDWGTTLIITSHDWEWLHTISDSVYTLFDGNLLENERDTIIFGPWEPHEDGLFKKKGSLSPLILVPEPPEPESAALFQTSALFVSLSQSGLPESSHRIKGTATRLTLDEKKHRIILTIKSGNMSFNAAIDRNSPEANSIFPGSELYISYNPEDIRFTKESVL